MATKSKKKNDNTMIYIGIGLVALVIAIVIAVVVMNKNKGGDGSGSGGTSSVVEYSSIDETISFGDYDGMSTLSKDIQNGNATGKIVKIDGLVSHPLSTYSIVQESEDGTRKIGTQFIIDGVDESDYPEDGSRVVVTGEVIEREPLVYIIKTTANNVEKR